MQSIAPLVSVITPLHNAEDFIEPTVRSVLAQSYPSIEHILVDDGSTDGSLNLISHLAAEPTHRVRIKSFANNRGASFARNRGAELANGAFLLFLDADDVLLPDAISALVAALRDPQAGIAIIDWERLRRCPDGHWRTAPADAPPPVADPETALRAWLDGSAWAPPCAVLWRRSAFEKVGGWDESLSLNDDGELAMRAFAKGTRIVRAVGAEVLYRAHNGTRLSVSHSFVREENFRSQVSAIEKLYLLLESQGRLGLFAKELGTAYQQAALMGFQNGYRLLALECQKKGEALAGRRIVSAKLLGRAIEQIFGLERKERIVQWLFSMGIATKQRQYLTHLRHKSAEEASSDLVTPVGPGASTKAAKVSTREPPAST